MDAGECIFPASSLSRSSRRENQPNLTPHFAVEKLRDTSYSHMTLFFGSGFSRDNRSSLLWQDRG